MEDVSTMEYLLMNKGGLDINRKDKVRKLHLFIMMMMMMIMMVVKHFVISQIS